MSEGETDFNKQLKADRSRALGAISPESPATHILDKLYPLLNGPLYPFKKGPEIARQLDRCVQTNLPMNLFAVVTAETAQAELPYLINAAKVFKNGGINTLTTTALIINWPLRITSAPPSPVLPNLVASATTLVRQAQLFENVEQITLEDNEIDPKDPLRPWLVRFYSRQRTMASIKRVIGFQVDSDLAVRRKIGRRISISPTDRLNLGLTTEFNPQLLRCYGRNIFLANIDVRSQRSYLTK